MFKTPFIDLVAENQEFFKEIETAVSKVIRSGHYILGTEVENFEKNVCEFTSAKHCIGVANGTDALVLALKSFNISENDEVITVSNSYFATASAIILAGAVPVLCDVEKDTGLISVEALEQAISSRTRAVIVVHLGGYLADMDKISKICKAHNLLLIEDCAQAFGSRDTRGKHAGYYGDIAAFSTHPLKNLAGMGDGGFILTDSDKTNSWLRKARSHGHISRDEIEFPSMNSRLDEMQAAILNVKIKYMEDLIAQRRARVLNYYKLLSGTGLMPSLEAINTSSHHLLIVCINKRDEFIRLMAEQYGIEIKIHYPKPYHKLSSISHFKISANLKNTEYRSRKMVSLPIGQHVSDEDIKIICREIIRYTL